MDFKNALKIDFTGKLPNARQFKEFDESVSEYLRGNGKEKLALVVDTGYSMDKAAPHVIVDHLNLTGWNPLVGPNNPIGERFPVVNNIYIENPPQSFSALPKAIVAGLKADVVPSKPELEKIRELGGEFFCYNLIPTMIIAAHAGWKILGIVVPEDYRLDAGFLELD